MINIEKKMDCCGCSACVQICPKKCIVLVSDDEGFSYPHVDIQECIDCGLCNKVCPIQNANEERRPQNVYAVINKNDEVRKLSSSGGAFSSLAEVIINEGGYVFGAKFGDDWQILHDYTRDREGIAAFRGSKYVQSEIGDSYIKAKEFLQNGEKVLFSGTPCQIAGLKKYLKKDYLNLITIDIICHGVPSPLVWREYIKTLTPKRNDGRNMDFPPSKYMSIITDINFRDKTKGWKKYGFSTDWYIIEKSDDHNMIIPPTKIKNVECHNTNLYMQGFIRNIFLRPSCYECKFRSGRSHSDITLGDYWGIQHVIPSFDDDKGCNLLLVNTPKGQKLLEVAESLNIEGTSYEQGYYWNHSLEKNEFRPRGYYYFWKLFFNDKHSLPEIIKLSLKKNKPKLFDRVVKKIKRLIKTNF